MTIDDTKMSEPMSKEEMIDTLKGLVFGTFDRTTAKEREALDMAIKGLENQKYAIKEAYEKGFEYGVKDWFKAKTEPCEDAISRQAVLDLMQLRLMPKEEYIAICNLPSVTPQSKTGHWIDARFKDEWYGTMYICSKCNGEMMGTSDFCPNCGADMREVDAENER